MFSPCENFVDWEKATDALCGQASLIPRATSAAKPAKGEDEDKVSLPVYGRSASTSHKKSGFCDASEQ